MSAIPINGMTLNKELRDKQMTGVGQEGDPMFSVRADGQQHAVGFNWQNGGGYGSANEGLGITLEGVGPLQRCQTPAVAVAVDTYNQTEHSTAQPVRSTASDVDHTGGVINPAERMAVRRLTPRECERLQGFKDDFTLIPWRGKSPQDCPDGPRYKALGNSMAVPCMAWIGKRIAAQHEGKARYLSVCSGIEAASVAWEPLGWQPAAFAEVEKFPSAVLAHHWPQVPNLGDMTRHESWNLGTIDLLVGGTPCQSFSVAGLRKGLHDPRGGLMLTFLEIAQRQRPRWIVWENVPGVLSSHGGRDFGAFLGALGALGYGWAYRVLDAQWFGVAQRRRRVFVVGCAGDGAAAATVLFESESVQRNPAPSREKGQGVAADAAGGAGSRSWPAGVASTLRKENGSPGYANQDIFSQGGANLVPSISMRESGQGYWMQDEVAGSLRAEGENRPSRPSNVIASGLPETVGTLSDGAHQGGGLNGQDAYTGRIFACARQPAHGADGQGDQHDLGRGADGDCVPGGGN
jgi:site-specific DNA-cytosine methylase